MSAGTASQGALTYPHLLSPLGLGPLQVRNRYVFCAHPTGATTDGLPTAQHTAYYGARAAGGVGLVVTEEHAVHPGDRPGGRVLRGWDPAVVPGDRAVAEAVHAHGALVVAQVGHAGGTAAGRLARRVAWAPSAVADPLAREVPLAMGPEEVAQVTEGFRRTAGHVRAAGMDGVELQCAHASLLGQLLSPATNRREDGYGGDAVRRARLLLEVVLALREGLGAGLLLGVRLTVDERRPGGTVPEDAVTAARALAALGVVDYLSTAVGLSSTAQEAITPGMDVPADEVAGPLLALSRALRSASGLPVLSAGRLDDPAVAEAALARGDTDLVGVVRGQVADPELVAKVRDGRTDEVRRCLACNQECVGRVGLGRSLRCVVAPRTGREARPLPAPARRRRHVLVVGGGPGGLAAALAAARRGHRATLLEREDRCGGRLRLAARAPARGDLAHLVDDLERDARREGVEVVTGCTADAAVVGAHAPDVVVLAAGAAPVPPSWAQGLPGVVDVRDVLAGGVTPRGDVLVVDGLGSHEATSVAELLAGRGCDVEVVTSAMVVGQDLGLTLDLRSWTVRAGALGVRQATGRVVVAGRADAGPAGRTEVTLLHHPTGARERRTVGTVVCCLPPRATDDLRGALAVLAPVHLVGDCLAPRRADAAVREGDRVGGAL